MSEAIIVAVIALVGEIIIAAITHSGLVAKLDKQSEVADTKMRGDMAVMEEEISSLRQEVQKHNQLIDRMYRLETRVSIIEDKIKSPPVDGTLRS